MEFSYSNFKITWIVTSKLFILQNKSVETGHDLKLPFFYIILIHKENVDTRVESKHTVPVIDHTCQTDVHFFSRKIQSIWSEIIRITLVIICLMSVCGGWSCLTSGTWHGVSHDPPWRLPWNSSYGHTPRIHKITYKNKIRSETE